ncbi:MAG: ChaN family lipoprotein, partial [Nitrospirae bacterium]|nr:ChaN family lipoprotein [Fimbriimonadaceae bacterium]
PEQRASLPEQFDLNNQGHRAVFGALMGGHPPTGTRGESIYSAQVLWDVGMADSAIKYMEALPRYDGVMAVVAGSGHVMYGQGINWRIAQRTGERGITVTMVAATDSITVSRGLGDYVYVAPGK